MTTQDYADLAAAVTSVKPFATKHIRPLIPPWVGITRRSAYWVLCRNRHKTQFRSAS